jgi:hypothetical protein
MCNPTVRSSYSMASPCSVRSRWRPTIPRCRPRCFLQRGEQVLELLHVLELAEDLLTDVLVEEDPHHLDRGLGAEPAGEGGLQVLQQRQRVDAALVRVTGDGELELVLLERLLRLRNLVHHGGLLLAEPAGRRRTGGVGAAVRRDQHPPRFKG